MIELSIAISGGKQFEIAKMDGFERGAKKEEEEEDACAVWNEVSIGVYTLWIITYD